MYLITALTVEAAALILVGALWYRSRTKRDERLARRKKKKIDLLSREQSSER